MFFYVLKPINKIYAPICIFFVRYWYLFFYKNVINNYKYIYLVEIKGVFILLAQVWLLLGQNYRVLVLLRLLFYKKYIRVLNTLIK